MGPWLRARSSDSLLLSRRMVHMSTGCPLAGHFIRLHILEMDMCPMTRRLAPKSSLPNLRLSSGRSVARGFSPRPRFVQVASALQILDILQVFIPFPWILLALFGGGFLRCVCLGCVSRGALDDFFLTSSSRDMTATVLSNAALEKKKNRGSSSLTLCYCVGKLHRCFHYDVDMHMGWIWPVVIMCRWCCPFSERQQ